jgi:histidyl-tRNA synthetase
MTPRAVRGVKDVLPTDSPLWRYVEATAADVFELYNFQEIRIPVFEKTEVFQRSIGETSDIVEKEMYTFTDRGGESLTLRPEGTASVVRAYIEHKMYNPPGVTKLYYGGPMFRAERPQAGRFRQFHQIGAEVLGTSDPAVDAELILMLMDFFTELKVPGLKVALNSLGCPACRPGYRAALLSFLKERATALCEACLSRIDRNPLRALDCKVPSCKEAVVDAPTIDQSLCGDCRDHFEKVRLPLLDLEVPVQVDNRLVRGLDYYSRTAFEVTSDALGAQSSVAGGGRYDTLVEEFGGPPTPAIGFAVGMERLISLIDPDTADIAPDLPDVFMVLMTDEARMRAFELAHRLRSYGYRVERAFEAASMKSQMRKADKSRARFVVILGEEEMLSGLATVKDMASGEQRKIPLGELAESVDDTIGDANDDGAEEGDGAP